MWDIYMENQIDYLEGENAKLKNKVDELEEENRKLNENIKWYEKEEDRLRERIRFLEQCLDNKEKVNKQLREELGKMVMNNPS